MSTVARQAQPITRAGYERLRAELDHLVTIRRRQMADELREARADGAEPENLGVAAVLGDQAALERRIDELQAALSTVRVVDPPADGVVGIGQRVRIRFAKDAKPIEYELVGPIEADPSARRISIESPVGQALLGHRAGDVVEVDTPSGKRNVEIIAVGDDS
jgi:transcription elongation factor GreA